MKCFKNHFRFSLVSILFLVQSVLSFEYTSFQDFENGSLGGWVVGGRQVGTNSTGVSTYSGSRMAYLSHISFTELILTKHFPYTPGMRISFDAIFSINNNSSPAPSGTSQGSSFNVYYVMNFLD